MARIAPELALSEAEVDGLMRRESRMRIATLGPGSQLHLTPMTFGWAGGKVYFFGRGQKIANLRRTSTATVLVDVGSQWRELRGVMMPGAAAVLEDVATEQADPHLVEAQINLGEKHGLDGAYQASASGRSRRWVVFTPERLVSWDNAKLPR